MGEIKPLLVGRKGPAFESVVPKQFSGPQVLADNKDSLSGLHLNFHNVHSLMLVSTLTIYVNHICKSLFINSLIPEDTDITEE